MQLEDAEEESKSGKSESSQEKSKKKTKSKKRREFTICHVTPGNPPNFEDIFVGTKKKRMHMHNHPLDKPGPCKDYCHDLCDDGNMCTINYKISNEECTCLAEPESLNCDDGDPETDDNCVPSVGCVHLPKTPKTIPVCSDEDAVPCGDDGGYFVCIFDEAHNIFNEDHGYKTVCSDDPSLISHVENEKDYCGQCSVSGQFISQSIVASIDPISSTEYVTSSVGDVFETEYDAVFNDFGLISLAASQDLIVQVDCANVGDMQGSIRIIFEGDIGADQIEKMFPSGALLVVDGEVFGSCDIAGESSIIMGPSLNGFLLIESVSSSSTQEVDVRGEVGSINYFFEKLSISYSLMERRQLQSFSTTQRRSLASEEFFETYSLVEPDDSPITINATLVASGSSFIRFSLLDWSFFSRSYEITCDFGFVLNAKLITSVVFDVSGTVPLFDRDFPSKKKD